MKLIVTNFNGTTEFIKESTSDKTKNIFKVESINYAMVAGELMPQKRVGIVRIKKEFSDALVADHGLKAGTDLNDIYKALGMGVFRIQIQETLTKQWDTQEPKINPETSEEILTLEGNQIFRASAVVPDVKGNADLLVNHRLPQVATVSAPAVVAEVGDIAQG